MRRTVEIFVVMIVAVLIIRVFVAEAYIVPTGSMAPALAGYHKAGVCPCCGHPVMVGHLGKGSLEFDPEDEREARRNYRAAACPNCGWDQLNLDQVAECPGDRLLVHKHIFELRNPRRWELIVFRNPAMDRAGAADTYIKRLVALPGESVQIQDGDVYINGAIARKTLAEVRALRLPVFDNAYQPRDADRPRWHAGKDSWWAPGDGGRTFALPARPAQEGYDWLAYRHLLRDLAHGTWQESEVTDVAGYNGGQATDRRVHDLLLETDVTCGGSGWLAFGLTDGHDDVLIELPVGLLGQATVRVVPTGEHPAAAPPPAAQVAIKLPAGKPLKVEAGLVDRRILLAVDGKEVFGKALDLPGPIGAAVRQKLSGPLALGGSGPVSVGGCGLEVRVASLRLFRDIHYTDRSGREVHPNAITRPVQLGAGEYFLLGDNSANSYDSRCWKNPAVREDGLVGKAFLVHLPTRLLEWRQFGEKRALAVPDWARMKLLR